MPPVKTLGLIGTTLLIAASAQASVVYLASNVTESTNTSGQSFLYTSGNNTTPGSTTISFLGSGTTLTSGVTTLEAALTYTQYAQSNGSPASDQNGRFRDTAGTANYLYSTARDLDGILLWNYNEVYSNATYNTRGITRADIIVTYNGGLTQTFQDVAFTQTANLNDVATVTTAQNFSFGTTLTNVTQITLTDLQGGSGGYQGWKEFAAYSTSAVPEPSTYGLLGAGALASVAFVRRRKR